MIALIFWGKKISYLVSVLQPLYLLIPLNHAGLCLYNAFVRSYQIWSEQLTETKEKS